MKNTTQQCETTTRGLCGNRLLISVGFCVWIFGCLASRAIVAADLPNLVLLMGDDHGWDETGYNGHPHLQTPVLDQMAKTGLRLDRFYSAHPTCSPTRGSVITGRHPNRYGTFTPNYSIRPEEIGIAELLHQAGYICGHFGKWHLGPVKADSPTNPGAFGFDQWLSHDNFFELNPSLSHNGGPPQVYPGESSEIVIQNTIAFAEDAAAKDKPFFAVVWFGSPHEPYSGLEKDLRLYDDLPAEYADIQFRLTSNETGRPVSRSLRDVLQERYAEITAMDRSIGMLRDWLRQKQIQDNTVLWYCGDNGTPGDGIVTSPLRGKKGNHYEGGVRVPGVIEWPAKIGTPAVSLVNSVTSDMLPTLCEIADVKKPDRPLDGISLLPLIEGEMQLRPKPIYFWSFDTSRESKGQPYLDAEAQRGTTPLVKMMGDLYTRNFKNFRHPKIVEADYGGTRVMLDNRFKLIVSGKQQKAELYDLHQDSAEQKNLVLEKPQQASIMAKELKAWQTSVLHSLTGADYVN